MIKIAKLLFTSFGVLLGVLGFAQSGSDLPPLEPGKCYAKCIIPDEYETVTDRIETRAAYTRMEVAIPTYETITERVMIKPSSVRLVAIPAEYEDAEERILVKEASKRYVVVPAVYETVKEEMMVQAESRRIIPIPGKWETITNDYFYYSDKDGISTEFGSLMDPKNPNNPNNPNSPFNPNNPNSPYNPKNPESPLNPNSPYNPDNPNSLWNPNNPDSPFHPNNLDKNLSDEFLVKSQIGAILPYLVKEATVEIERIPAEYETITDEIEIAPKAASWEQRPSVENCDSPNGDCMIWCYVEVPAQYQTVTKLKSKGCANGWFLSGRTANGKDECARVIVKPAEYGARSIFVAAPSYREEVIPARYETITKQVVKKAAEVQEIEVPAEYKVVKTKVVKKAAGYRYEVIPADYKTMRRKVRKGLKAAGYLDPTGTMVLADPSDPKSYPAIINPATGYPMTNIPGNGFPNNGNPFAGDPTDAAANFDPGSLDPFYTAGCPSGYAFDPSDNICKSYVTLPAAYDAVTKTALKKKGTVSTEWQEILCPNKVSPSKVREVQRALRDKGYDPGPIDNVMGAKTKAALAKYQKDNNLPVGGLNLPTLRSLGVRF